MEHWQKRLSEQAATTLGVPSEPFLPDTLTLATAFGAGILQVTFLQVLRRVCIPPDQHGLATASSEYLDTTISYVLPQEYSHKHILPAASRVM